MHLIRFIIIAALFCAPSKSTGEHATNQAPGKLKGNTETTKLPSIQRRNATGTSFRGRNANTETVETLFIPEDPNEYEEILNYVRKLLEETASKLEQEPPSTESKTNEKKNQNEETRRKSEELEVEESPEVSKETRENNRRKGDFENTSERDELSVDGFGGTRRNSSFAEIARNEDKYSPGNSVPLRKIAVKEEGDSRSAVNEINDGDGKEDDEGTPDEAEADILEAAKYGLRAMHELYYVKEPTLYSMGLYLESDNPAKFVAAFNAQSDQARALAKYGFAVLQGATEFMKKFPDTPKETLSSRRSHRNPLQLHCPSRGIPDCPFGSLRYRTSDGSCNNLRNLWWGSAMSTMNRFLPAVYQDGIQSIRRSKTGRPLPSAREISDIIHEDRDVPLASVTHMLMQWGQFVDHDLTATGQSRGFNGTIPQCCLNGGGGFQPPEFMHPECLPIAVNPQDSFYGPMGVRCLEFLRSGAAPREDCEFGPREQLSQVTSYLDASTVYSSNAFQTDTLRLFRNGLLQYGRIQSRRPLLPRQDSDICRRGSLSTSCFRAGDGRLSEQPALTSLHVVFLRLHNRIATKLAALNSHWSDEKLFQETRRIVGAVVQHITYREFLPIILGQDVMKIFDLEVLKKGYYEKYDPTVNPTIANGFSTAAYRFGHSLVQRSFVRFDSHHTPLFNNVSIHDEFSNPVNLETAGSVDRILLGLINQPSQRRDEFISDELTNHLFQTPRFPFGMDLASLNVQRGRDHGIPAYVEWREPCGLSAIRGFEDLNRVMSPAAARKFKLVYSTVEDIDLFPAGLAENSVNGGLVGPTFACIIGQQFGNLRRGDRFWYENPESESSFTPGQLQQIRRVSLAQVLCTTMDSIETIQPFVFLIQDGLRNHRISCNDPEIGLIDLEFWAERSPESRSRGSNFEKNRNVPQKSTARPNLKDQTSTKLSGSSNSELQKFLPTRQKPFTANIHQQNRIVVKRPLGPPDNVTIVVQNNAVNSPVFVNDAIYGSHIKIAPTHKQEQSTVRPPFDHRPVNQDESVSGFPAYPPKPIPTSVPNALQSGRPYVPYGFDDPSNPNPLSQGFQSSYLPDDVVFDTLSMTSPRPTLYTYYTKFQQRPTTQQPQTMDDHPGNHSPQDQPQVYPTSPRPSTNSWSNLEADYEVNNRPTKPTYVSLPTSQVQDDGIKLENWQKLQQHRPIEQPNDPGTWESSNYQNKPTNRPSQLQQNDPGSWDSLHHQNRPSVRPIVHHSQQNDPVAWDSLNYQKRPVSRPIVQHSQQTRPSIRPSNYDDFITQKEKPNIRPTFNPNDHNTRPAASYQVPFVETHDRHDSEISKRPFHQIASSKRPVQADPDGWSTIPSYPAGSIGPATYHDEALSNAPSYQTEHSSKPTTFPSYELSTVQPIVSHDSNRFPNLPDRQQSIDKYQQNEQQDNSYGTPNPHGRPVQSSFDRFQEEFHRKPVQNKNQYHYSMSSERPGVSSDHFAGVQFNAKPINKPSHDQIDRPSDNPYQTSKRPEYSGFQVFKTEGEHKPPKVHSVTIVTETAATISRPNYQADRVENRVTSEIPRPLSSSLTKDKSGNRKPGQYYYEKNVLHRYPDSAEDEGLQQNYQLSRERTEQRHKVIGDVDHIVDPVIDESKINLSNANETVGNNGTKVTKPEIGADKNEKEDGDVTRDLAQIISKGTSSAASSDSTNHWLRPEESSTLPSVPEVGKITGEESLTSTELPGPIKLRRQAS